MSKKINSKKNMLVSTKLGGGAGGGLNVFSPFGAIF
jgi:hypothetical protein